MKKILSIFLVLCLALSGLSALAEDSHTTSNDTLVVGNTTAMSGNFLAEMFGNNTADLDVRQLLHAYNLMTWSSEVGSYKENPTVVSKLDIADDWRGNRTYTVTIASDLKYSDGTPITTADYAFAMLLSMAPEMTEIGAQTVFSDYIVGSEAYNAGETNVLKGMRMIDKTTLSITVQSAYEPFFYEMGLLDYNPLPIGVIAPGCEVVDLGEGVLIRNIDETIEEPIFTAELLRETILDPEKGYLSHPSIVSGAYVLDGYDAEAHTAAFSKNPYFKGDARGNVPSIPHLVYKHVAPEQMIDALSSGEVGLLNKCTAASVIDQGIDLTSSDSFAMTAYPRTGYSFISFNCERTAVSSESLRQAMAHCLDKDALVSAYVGSYGVPVDGYYGIGQWMYELVSGKRQLTGMLTDDELEELASMSLDNVKVYELNIAEAIRLLESDGWTLNRSGKTFDPQTDDVRCKEIDGQLVALDLTMIYPEGNAIADCWEETFLSNLAKAGIKLTAEPKPMDELLSIYYREVERDCDMIYLATNFATVFDPSYTFAPEDAYQGNSNRSGIIDQRLYQRTVDMRLTEPGDVLEYCRKWIVFQERWSKVLPAIPVYSNTYYDFYTSSLKNYQVASDMTWTEAIIAAYLE